MPQLALSLLGPLQVRLDDQPLSGLAYDKVRALLAYLAVEARPHGRDALSEMLWPGQPPAASRRSLRVALTTLRQALSDKSAPLPFLIASRDTVQVNPASVISLDVTTFGQLLRTCQSHVHSSSTLCAECAARLQEVMTLYRGEFLQNLTVRDSVAFEEWVTLWRERLHRQALDALAELAAYHEDCGDDEQARQYAWRTLALESWDEAAYRCVMRVLSRKGQRSAALAQYARCRKVLAEELGAEPSAETTALYEQIRTQPAARSVSRAPDSMPAEQSREERAGGSGATSVRAGSTPTNLPAPPTPFVGRTADLAALNALLADPATRLVTITGPGGMGKTRLAIALAQQLLAANRFPDGVFFVFLAPLQAVESIVFALAEALAFPLDTGQRLARSPRQQVCDYLREKRLLLILDNVEHLLNGAEANASEATDLIATLLGNAPGVAILATSRERLKLHTEQVYLLGGLDTPNTEAPLDSSAVTLFLQCARRLRPAFAPARDQLDMVARICRLVAGMPLAIELAAGWVDTLALPDIAAEIERGLDLLATALRDVPVRHRSMRAVFDASWHRLGAAEQAVFAQLAILRGGGTRQAVQAVTRATLPQLHALVGASLVQYDVARDRYTIHELLRQYAAEQLAADPTEEHTTRERHAAYFCGLLRDLRGDLHGSHQLEALATIEADGENVRTAWEWAARQGNAVLIEQAMESLGSFFQWQGRTAEGKAAYRLAATALTSAAGRDAQRVRAKLLAWQSRCASLLGDSSAASALLQQSRQLLDGSALADADARAERAFVLLQAGQLAAEHDYPAARAAYDQSRALFHALGEQWGEAAALSGLGAVALDRMGDYDLAQRYLHDSLALRRTLGDRLHMTETLAYMSNNARYRGQVAESERLARECYELSTTLANRRAIAIAGSNLGIALTWNGNYAESRRLLQETVAIYMDLGDRAGLANAYFRLGMSETYPGHYPEARATLTRGLSISRTVGATLDIGGCLQGLTAVTLAEGVYCEARRWGAEAIALLEGIGERFFLNAVYVYSALAERSLGNQRQARHLVITALRSLLEKTIWGPTVRALATIALLLADAGEPERAAELYALTERENPFPHSSWSLAVYRRELAAVAAALPADVAAAAEAGGRARDLWATAEELLVELEARWASSRVLGSEQAGDETPAPGTAVLSTAESPLTLPPPPTNLPTSPSPLIGREADERLVHPGAPPATSLALQMNLGETLMLVGRTQEWAQLQAAWRAAAGGRPHVAVLAGEAGIGKTRLAEELTSWVARQGIATATALCYAAEGAPAYAPITAWLRSDALRPALARLDTVWLTEVARLAPELLVERPDLPRPNPLTEPWQRQHLRDALARAVLGGRQPLLLFIDDMQWCDLETLEWLHYLLRFDPRAPLLLVATVRSEELTNGHSLTSWLAALRRAGQVTEIELSPLDQAETAALAAQVTGVVPDQALAMHLYIETEGNPLFVVETARAGSAPDSHLLPSTMQAVIATRLAQLTRPARDLVQLAAAIGRLFTVEVLTHAGDGDEDTLVRRLDELWQRRIVREHGDNAYDFSHDKIREVAYSEMSATRRRMLHRRVAGALERVHAHDLDAVSGQIAAHYERAGQAGRAVAYYRRAADVAGQVYSNHIAVAHLEKGLVLLKDLPNTPDRNRQELELQVSLAASLRETKGMASLEAEQAYDRAFELCQQVEQTIQLFPVVWGLHQVYMLQGKPDKAREMAEQCLQLARHAQDPALLLQAHHAMWGVLYLLSPNELPLALEHAEHGIAIYDLKQHHSQAFLYGGHDPGVCCRLIAANALWLLGYPDQALKRGQEALDLSHTLSHPWSLALALAYTAKIHIHHRDARAVSALATATVALATEKNMAEFLAEGMIMQGWAMAEQGDVGQGIAQIRQGIAKWTATGMRMGQAYPLALLAESYRRAGQVDQGLASVRKALAAAHATGEHSYDAEIYRLTGELLLAAGQPAEQAESSYQQALQIARRQRTRWLELRAAVSLGRLWQRQGRHTEARQMLSAIYDWFSEGFDTPDLKDARSLLQQL